MISLALSCAAARAAQTNLAARAQPVGVPLSTIIDFGDQYQGGDELYDAKITVLEIVRGERAWAIIQHAGASNPRPTSGFDYLLARIRFEFSARAVPVHYSYSLAPAQFRAVSAESHPYDSPALAAPPAPLLEATLRPGDSAEGWVAFLVPRSERAPLMLFAPDVGNTFHEGSSSLFRLYGTSPVGSKRKSP